MENQDSENWNVEMSLNDKEKKQLADLSLMETLSKVELMAHVRSTLWDLDSRIRRYQNYGNSSRDPELTSLREKLTELSTSIPNSGEDLLKVLGTDPENYAYTCPGEDIDLLLEEAGLADMEELEETGSCWEDELPYEDPLEVYKRNK